jgi:hypothetical protein
MAVYKKTKGGTPAGRGTAQPATATMASLATYRKHYGQLHRVQESGGTAAATV